jgi:hypothetical protein
MKSFVVPLATVLFYLCLSSCASRAPGFDSQRELAAALQQLHHAVSAEEATLAAETAFTHSLTLARNYRTVRPALVQNVLVNAGLKQRGLCFHWAEDLSARLEALNLRTLEVHRGVARLETRREHSSVVLTARSQPFPEGIVLDAWRHSGRLYWNYVTADKYPWIRVEVIPEWEVEHDPKKYN